MRVSQYFKLTDRQPTLDFVDVDVVNDTPLFIDPQAFLSINSEWTDQCVSLIQHFFGEVLAAIQRDDARRGRQLLSYLREPNETHLGLSRGRSQGRGLGRESSIEVYDALAASQAARSGLLEDLEDAVLIIPGIDRDIISDIATNIIRGPLITYTQEVCEYYNIPTNRVDSGPIWNPQRVRWENGYVQLPVAYHRRLLLVPKAIVRLRPNYDSSEYFNHYVLSYLQGLELSAGSSLVEVLKYGRRRVTKRAVRGKYGSGKAAAARITLEHPEILEQYRQVKRRSRSAPMSHSDLAWSAGFEEPDFADLLGRAIAIPAGPENATNYHHAVERLLSAVFYPALTSPRREFNIHEGRKRIDIRYENAAHSGFFDWLARHYPAGYIWCECKNYSREIGNPELDQLSGRFSPQRGRVGLLLYRGYVDKDEVWQRCIDTAHDDRGWIIPLDDNDLVELVTEREGGSVETAFAGLRARFDRLIM